VLIRGRSLPGRSCGPYDDIHVGLQVGSEPCDIFPADAERVEWVTEVRVVDADFRGPAVQGRKGERFIYLTWGTLTEGVFTMFRRAKLMLADLPLEADVVTVDVDLTDDAGMPRCARLRPPAIRVS
jgi:hypothetical protein